jgi:hypothetical protein
MEAKPYRHVVAWGIFLCLNALQLTAAAGLVPVTLGSSDFDTLLGGEVEAIGSPLITNVTSGDLLGQVVSQAFTDGQGNYAYLYQVNDIGTNVNHIIEQFTCNPFIGASAATVLGYLTANAPDGFTLGQRVPIGGFVNMDVGPTVAFGFIGWFGWQINPGESSSSLYIISDKSPGLIGGYIIDGAVASGQIVGPVPEPATLGIMGVGAIVLYLLRGKTK